ncbi:Ktr system potassium uptake protein B [Streptomyces sp. enrichment culture]|uniref:potassium transporter TrkG n=1 Tax=Streptomyces sp. enrichment culture TaxID=1795815 RepID=UPI003F5650D3
MDRDHSSLKIDFRYTAYDTSWPRAVWLGVFHSVSAFNNAGFALYSDSLMSFATDPWICLPIAFAGIAGELGFPVLFELRRRWRRPPTWSLHTKILVWASGVFLVGGSVLITTVEWTNPATLGPLDTPGKLLAGSLQGVMPRTAGFHSVDTGRMHPTSWPGMDVLMFVGGASAGTAGGSRPPSSSCCLWSTPKSGGAGSVNIFQHRLHGDIRRQALTVVLLPVAAVVGTTMAFMIFTEYDLDRSLFEVVSAFATAGLSTGITADLPTTEQILLMSIGRLGPITVASALAPRSRVRMYDLPEERPVIGQCSDREGSPGWRLERLDGR